MICFAVLFCSPPDFCYSAQKISQIELTPKENAWLSAHPKITLGTDQGWRPYIFLDDAGSISGIEADLISRINTLTGANIRLTTGKWSDMVEKATSRKIDGLAISAYHEERSAHFLFTKSSYSAFKYIYSSTAKINKMSDLTGKRVAVLKGNLFDEKLLTKTPGITIVPVDDHADIVTLFTAGQVDAAIAPISLNYFLTERLLSDIKLAFVIPDSEVKILYSIRKDWPELQSIINKALGSISLGERQTLLRKWIGGSVTNNNYRKITLTSEERSWLRNHPDLKLISPADFEPYLIIGENGSQSGILVDILKILNQRLGSDIRIQVTPLADYSKTIQNRDVAGIMAIDSIRKHDLHMLNTEPYLSVYPTIFSLSDSNITGIEDLKGKTVAILKGSVSLPRVLGRYLDDLNIVTAGTLGGLEMVLDGRVDAMLGYNFNKYLITKNFIQGVKAHVLTNENFPTSMSIRADLPELVPIMNKGLSSISAQEKHQILSRWINISDPKESTVQFTKAERLWLAKNHFVNVYTLNLPPYIIKKETGLPEGIAIDYLKLIARRTGIKFRYVSSKKTIPVALEELKKQQGPDLIPVLTHTPERDGSILFSTEYFKSPYMIFTRRDDNRIITRIDDLLNKKIAISKGFPHHEMLEKKFPSVTLMLFESDKESIDSVLTQEADAFIGDMITTACLILDEDIYNLEIAGPCPFGDTSFAIGSRNDWPELNTIINKGLSTITLAEKRSIRNKYISIQLEQHNLGYMLKWGLLIVILGLGIILLFFLWNQSLRKLVLKRTESLTESEKKFRTIFESLQDGYFRNNLDGDVVFCNQEAASILGYTMSELMTKNMAEDIYYHPEARNKMLEIMSHEKIVKSYEVLLRHKEGRKIFIEANIHLIYENNIPLYYEGTIRDITERKEREKENARLAATIHQSFDHIVITDTSGRIEYVNPAFVRATGYTFSEVVGQNPRILKSDKHDQAFYNNLWRTIKSGRAWVGNILNKRKDGSLLDEQATIFPIFDQDNNIINYAAVKRDETEHRQLETRLQQAQKMESIGNLAGGIAHDFNNLLFPIVGLSELLIEDLPSGSTEVECVQEILNAGLRGRDLVKQILAFSRQAEHKMIPVKVQRVLTEVIKLCRASIPMNIDIHQHIQEDCSSVIADPTQLHQIAMNLITNAFHALEETGDTISVTLTETFIDNDGIAGMSLQTGKYAVFSVADNGAGIKPDVIGRIFEPYFTTKQEGKGTGLGLATVYGLVKEHKGDIQLQSKMGQGTTFSVYLPVIETGEGVIPDPQKIELQTGVERILLVDDEAPITNLLRKLLESLGYTVTVRNSSLDALAKFKNNPAMFDLVITDMAMPNITGDELTKKLLEIRPDIPVIIATGFSDGLNKTKISSIGARGLLMKPVLKNEMAQMVRNVLDELKKT